MRVLIIEDDRDDAQRGKEVIEQLIKAEIVVAADSEEAESAIQSGDWDIMFIDFCIPGPKTGVDLARMAHIINPTTSIMFVSGLPMTVSAALTTQEKSFFQVASKDLRLPRMIHALLDSVMRQQAVMQDTNVRVAAL